MGMTVSKNIDTPIKYMNQKFVDLLQFFALSMLNSQRRLYLRLYQDHHASSLYKMSSFIVFC
jgi:hypothetical protein